jgi:hypothetical protein
MATQKLIRRPYQTLYFDSVSAAGKKPVAMGYCTTLKGARRCIAVHLVLGDYPLGVVMNRHNEKVVSHMRRNKMGLFIGDHPENAYLEEDRRGIPATSGQLTLAADSGAP